ncbi:MAG: hypothetical protein QOH15_3177, partial [Gaiellales bacterium]|nr:hypothetical protein [Gaiellales bacterium]
MTGQERSRRAAIVSALFGLVLLGAWRSRRRERAPGGLAVHDAGERRPIAPDPPPAPAPTAAPGPPWQRRRSVMVAGTVLILVVIVGAML